MFRSLQRRIVAVFVGLLVLVMLLILALVAESSRRIVAAEMARELHAGGRVFARVVEQNQRQLETAAAVLSADFGFRSAIATQDRPTIRSVLRNHGSRIGAQVMLAVSPDGQLIAGTQTDGVPPSRFPFPDLLAQAGETGHSAGFRQLGNGRLYQLVLVPIEAPRVIAWVAMGFPVDDRWARQLSALTGLAVSVVRRDASGTTLLASSLDGAPRRALSAVLAPLRDDVARTVLLGDEHLQSLQHPLGNGLSVVLQRSMEQAEAPFSALQTTLWSVVLGGIALFVAGSVMVARRIAGPVNQLAGAARQIEAGDYALALPRLPADEIGQLAASFDRMREGIAAREQKILKLAYEDTLTGLPNRTRFLAALGEQPPTRPAAILVLDLDRFAMINDALGHPIGDRLLIEVGARLAAVTTPPNLVARLWGDEFAFLLDGADEAAAQRFAEDLLTALRDPIPLDDQRLDVGGSLGIALYPRDGHDTSTLLRRAELAMYVAKQRQSGYAFTTGTLGDPPHEQLSLIGEMREALVREEFLLHYQPKLDLASGRVVGAEALLRWRHPQRGMVPPMRFIPFAERTGFIREITPWVLARVTAQAARWRAAGLSLVPSLNLSARDLLNPDLVPRVAGLLGQFALPADGLCLEITESALMEDPQTALLHLSALATLGVKLSIDDYGAGHASLAYLKTLPVHELKIDQAFVRTVTESAKDAAIVRSTIVLGHALGLAVVAEGAETQEAVAWLRNTGCDTVQGYAIARPMPADELPGWLADVAAEAQR